MILFSAVSFFYGPVCICYLYIDLILLCGREFRYCSWKVEVKIQTLSVAGIFEVDPYMFKYQICSTSLDTLILYSWYNKNRPSKKVNHFWRFWHWDKFNTKEFWYVKYSVDYFEAFLINLLFEYVFLEVSFCWIRIYIVQG